MIATPQWTPLAGRATAQSRPPDQRSRMRPSMRRSTTSERRPHLREGGQYRAWRIAAATRSSVMSKSRTVHNGLAHHGQFPARAPPTLPDNSAVLRRSVRASRRGTRRRWVRGRAERPRRRPVTSPRPVRPRLRQLGAVCRSRPHTPLGRRVGIACRASRGVQPDVASTATPACRSVGACGSAGWLRLFPLTPGASHVPAR